MPRWETLLSSQNNRIYMIGRRRQWHPTPVFLPGESQGRGSLEGCSPWGRWGSDTTERLHFHFSLSRIGERNGNSLQCSCLENPRDGEPVGLPSLGSYRNGHDWSDLAAAAAYDWRQQRINKVVKNYGLWFSRMKSSSDKLSIWGFGGDLFIIFFNSSLI